MPSLDEKLVALAFELLSQILGCLVKTLVIIGLRSLVGLCNLRFGLGQRVFELAILNSDLRGRFMFRVQLSLKLGHLILQI